MGVEVNQLCYNVWKGLLMQKPYQRTLSGKIHYIYTNQRTSSKNRGMEMPLYSKAELKEWLTSNPLFIKLFKAWEDSGYNRMFAPSVDRKDDSKPYSMDNIQVMSFRDNNKKSHKDRRSGKLITSQNRSVRQYTKDGVFIEEFYSINEAGRQLNINSSHIGEVCKFKRKSAGGFLWEYSDGGVISE